MGTLKKWSQKLGFSPGKLPQDPYQSPDPYGGGVEWDSSGMPVGKMPRGGYTLDYQYEANRRAEQRRNALWGDAQNVLRQGTDLLQSYRPGGSAALASGIYGQRANLYGTQAQTIEAPDLLIGHRQHEQEVAERDRKRANRLNRTIGLIKMGAGLAGMGATGGASAALIPDSIPQEQAPESQQGGQDVIPRQQQGIIGPPASAQQPIAGQGYGAPIGPTPGGQPLGMQLQPGAGQPGGPQGPPAPGQQGGFGGGGGGGDSAQQRQPGGGAAGGGPDSPGGGGAMGGGGMGPTAPPMSTFTSAEAATNAMMSAPASGAVVYPEWADDPIRQQSTFMVMSSARARLVAAMAGDSYA